MTEEKFTAKPFKVGNSTVLTIPAFLVKEKKIALGKEYDVSLQEKVTN